MYFLRDKISSPEHDKSINWSDTSDFIAYFENIFASWDKILEDTIQNNLEVFKANVYGGVPFYLLSSSK